MKLDASMKLEQKLKLSLTLQMKMSLEILQETNLEIEERIKRELEENPLLERLERDEAPRRAEGFPESQLFVMPEADLREVLRNQLLEMDLSREEKGLLLRLIEYVDGTGYLGRYFLDPIFQNCSEEVMERLLFLLQGMEPRGVGARNLKECLLLQIRFRGWLLEPLKEIVEEHLEDLAAGRHLMIMENLGLEERQWQQQLDMLYQLDPKPGLRYQRVERSDYIVPDIILEMVGGKMQIQLNERSYPELTLSTLYDRVSGLNEEAQSYIRYKRKQAIFLMDALKQRRETIIKVMESILRHQHVFFYEGGGILYLTREDIARDVNMHNSTVSRAVQGKYLYWKNRNWPLNDFFPKGIINEDGTAISHNSIKMLIANIIEQESPKRPYSDEKIKKMLNEMNVEISRRTVAKYRDELQIPNSSQRKR